MTRLRRFPVGKLPPRVLERLLERCPILKGSGVVIGPRFGEDAAVIDMGSKYLVAKTDPITFTAERIGWYAVNVNANDIATLGARPRWFLATLLLPQKKATQALAQSILTDILRACRALGVALVGGHTEITAGLERPIVVGQMLGEVEKTRLIRKDSQRPGDVVILTKGVAIEGTAILARDKWRVLERRLGRATVHRARCLLFRPGISIVPEALLAIRHGEVRAMHDPTEGGLLAGLYELARAGRVGLWIRKESIPVLGETRAFARVLEFDPLGLIASGALLVVATARSAPMILRAYQKNKILAAVVGEVRRESEGLCVFEEGREPSPLRAPPRDEIARLLEG